MRMIWVHYGAFLFGVAIAGWGLSADLNLCEGQQVHSGKVPEKIAGDVVTAKWIDQVDSVNPAEALQSKLVGSAKAQPDSVRGDLTTVPFIFDDNRIYISVSSPTGPLGWFILDTGVSDALIDSDSAERLGLPIDLTAPERGAGSGTLDIGASRSATLVVGKTTLHLETTRIAEISKVLEPYSGRKIGGIIGGALFREHVVTIDIARHRIELRDPHRFQYPERGQVVSFEFVNGVPIAAGHITLPDGDRLQLRLLVDLGAKANLLVSEPFVEQNHLRERFTTAVVEPLGAGIGGETWYGFVRLPCVTVGGAAGPSMENLVAGLSVKGTLRGGYYDALLGTGFLRNYRVTFDYARHQVIFEGATRKPPDPFDESGVFVVADPNSRFFLVKHVVAGSPGEEAGMQNDDVIETIGGKSATLFDLGKIRTTLRGAQGRVVSLGISRGGQKLSAVVSLRKLL